MFSTYFTGSFKREMVGGRNSKKLKTNRKSVLKTCDFRVAAPLLKINVGISLMYIQSGDQIHRFLFQGQ